MHIPKKSQSISPTLSKPQINHQLAKECTKSTIQSIEVYTPYQPYETQKSYMSYIIRCLNNSQTAVIQSPTGTGKTLSLLSSTLAWQYNYALSHKQFPQIFYTSRTHQQLKQSISELKKLPYNIKSCVLSSRQQSCINLQLKQLSGKDKGFECRKRITHQQGKSCTFYKPEQFYTELSYNGKPMDLDDINFRAKCQQFCPYFYNRNLKATANIVFMPYNYLFEENFMEQNGLNLAGSIVIVDEAHNLQQTLEQAKEYSFTLNVLGRALGQISELHEKKLEQLKNSTNDYQIDDIEDFGIIKANKWKSKISSSLQSIQYHASYVTMVHFYFQTLDIPVNSEGKTYTIAEFICLIQKATEDSEFGAITKRLSTMINQLKSLRNDLKFRPYWALESWTFFIQKVSQLYQIHQQDPTSSKFKIQLLYEGSDIKLNIYCLDPAIGMRQILNHKLHCLILTSGTLSPMKSFIMELGLKNVEPASCPHIIEPDQAKTYIVTKGPNIRLNFSYENRHNRDMYSELGLVLTEIIKNTKNGVVVFFPSYQLLEETVKHFNTSKVISKIYEHKTLHVESRENAQFTTTLESYLKAAQTPKGAVLFALIRGKISEGLDFADEKCRAVIIVGVPYPARKDIKVVAKIQYLNELGTKEKDVLNGQKWYLSEAIRSINQGIGRIIRHKKDFGAIYLLDERYEKEKPDLKSQLSSWAKASLTIITNYSELADGFKRNKEQFMVPAGLIQNQQNLNKGRKIVGFGNFKSISGGFKKLDKPASNNLEKSSEQQKRQKPKSLKEMIQEAKKTQLHTINPIQQQKNQQKPINPLKPQKPQKSQPKQQKPPAPSRQQQIFQKTKISLKPQEKITPIDQLQQCVICTKSKKLVKNSVCIHKICQQCWDQCLKNDLRCPLCRTRIRAKYLEFDE